MKAAAVVRDLLMIFKSGVDAVRPENLVKNSIKFNSVTQLITPTEGGQPISVVGKNIHIVGIGKAVKNMAKQLDLMLTYKVRGGIVSIPVGNLDDKCNTTRLQYLEGAQNNLPDANAEAIAAKINELALSLGSDDILLVLISGGGSALLPMPRPPITLEEKTALIKKLANSGADITELNIVRKKLSDLKGGKLALKAQPAKVVSLILSDIVGDPLDLIACGPTAENTDAPNAAKDIITKFNLLNDLPDSIKSVLDKDDDMIAFPEDNVRNIVIGSNKISMSVAEEKATSLGWPTITLSDIVTGNVTEVAKKYARLAKIFCSALEGKLTENDFTKEMQSLEIPGVAPSRVCTKLRLHGVNFTDCYLQKQMFQSDMAGTSKLKALVSEDKLHRVCIILGGEITVEVNGEGKGGRNQHLALEFSRILNTMKDDLPGYGVFLLSAGTDGIDGPTDAAGAIGYLDLIAEATEKHMNVQEYLDNCDSYNFYKNFNPKYHVVTGHTNTNVMDLHILVIMEKRKKYGGN